MRFNNMNNKFFLDDLEYDKADYYFESEDGRTLPCFTEYPNKFITYKTKEHPYTTTSALTRKIKLDKIIKNVKQHVSTINTCRTDISVPVKLIDIGAGTGLESILFAKYLNQKVDAIDTNPWFTRKDNTCDDVKKWLNYTVGKINADITFDKSPEASYDRLNVNYKTQDALSMPFADNAYDVIFSKYVLLQIADIDSLFKEIRRILKPNGLLVAVLENFYYWEICKIDGVIEIPFGHALLSERDYVRYIDQYHSKIKRQKAMRRIRSLSRRTPDQWIKYISSRMKIIDYHIKTDNSLNDMKSLNWIKKNLPKNILMDDLFISSIMITAKNLK